MCRVNNSDHRTVLAEIAGLAGIEYYRRGVLPMGTGKGNIHVELEDDLLHRPRVPVHVGGICDGPGIPCSVAMVTSSSFSHNLDGDESTGEVLIRERGECHRGSLLALYKTQSGSFILERRGSFYEEEN